MLASANRLTRADDYRRLVRRGRRITRTHFVTYVTVSSNSRPVRFGFIVSKTVGVAVVRNQVRRRLKAVGYEMLSSLQPGTDVVIRALPAAAQVDWVNLRSEITESLRGAALIHESASLEGSVSSR